MSFQCPQDETTSLPPAIAIPGDQPAPLLGTKTPEPSSRSPSINRQPSPAHSRGQSESSAMLLNISKRGHKRCGSETSTIKQRGRAKQRPPPVPGSNPEDSFDTLPVGFPAAEAPLHMTLDELKALGKQALRQAVQFEVLSPSHVKRLSKVGFRLLRSSLRTMANGVRNFAPSTNDANTCGQPTGRSVLDDAIYTAVYAITCALQEQPSSHSTV